MQEVRTVYQQFAYKRQSTLKRKSALKMSSTMKDFNRQSNGSSPVHHQMKPKIAAPAVARHNHMFRGPPKHLVLDEITERLVNRQQDDENDAYETPEMTAENKKGLEAFSGSTF